MKNSVSARASVLLFLSAMTVSSLTMLWLLWRFPVVTASAGVLILAGIFIAARLAKALEGDSLGDADRL